MNYRRFFQGREISIFPAFSNSAVFSKPSPEKNPSSPYLCRSWAFKQQSPVFQMHLHLSHRNMIKGRKGKCSLFNKAQKRTRKRKQTGIVHFIVLLEQPWLLPAQKHRIASAF
ncbi:hypothetical protein [Akkermansia muciniphila]|uniref:hypothetical protein n=1 Tax=Akkermansia muciniphila TaxID=239935 RepID=UPI0011AEDCD5|nr:hypothetical protein [Akkermansia muciniphila]